MLFCKKRISYFSLMLFFLFFIIIFIWPYSTSYTYNNKVDLEIYFHVPGGMNVHRIILTVSTNSSAVPTFSVEFPGDTFFTTVALNSTNDTNPGDTTIGKIIDLHQVSSDYILTIDHKPISPPRGRVMSDEEWGFKLTGLSAVNSTTATITSQDRFYTVISPSPAQINDPPTASINTPGTDQIITAGDSLVFAGTGVDPEGFTMQYRWNFGGAGPADDINEDPPGLITFNTPGSFTTTFTVSDNKLQETSNTVQITVNAAPTPPPTPAPPVIIITGPTGTPVINYNQSLNFQADVTSSTPYTVTWNFDGGAPNSAVEDPGSITFNKAGTFNVQATADNGATDTDNVIVTVNRPPVDIVFVLDSSGSMRDSSKFDHMAMATQMYYDLFKNFSNNSILDRWSAVYFQWHFSGNTTVTDPVALSDIDGGAPNIFTTIMGHKPPQVAGYMTPIGEGLIASKNILGSLAQERKKVFLLLSDGMENAGTAIETVPIPTAASTVLQDNITIYSIGMGEGTEIEADKIRDKAMNSGGDYKAAIDPADPWVLYDFFAEILCETILKAERATVLDYGTYADCYITTGTKKAVFIINTQDATQPLNFDLVHPDGTTVITPASMAAPPAGLNVYYSEPIVGEPYSFYVIEDTGMGLTTATSDVWEFTNYRHAVVGTPLAIDTHEIVIEDLTVRVDFAFDNNKHYTGDTIKLMATLKDGSRPVKGARVVVTINTPAESLGTMLVNGIRRYGIAKLVPFDQKVADKPPLFMPNFPIDPLLPGVQKVKSVIMIDNPNALIPGSSTNKSDTLAAAGNTDSALADMKDGLDQFLTALKLPVRIVPVQDTYTLVQQIRAVAKYRDHGPRDMLAGQILVQDGRDSMEHTKEELLLYDDGTHGDAKADDGIYTLDYNKTYYEGNYNFTFNAMGRTEKSIPFMRSQTISEYVRVRPDPGSYTATATTLSGTKPGVIRKKLTIKPKDKFGNLIGPLYDNIRFTSTGSKEPLVFYDNLDGSYSAVIEYNQGQTQPQVTAAINDLISPLAIINLPKFELQIKGGHSL